MRKIITLVGILLLYSSAFAQFEDNKWVLGGELGINAISSNDRSVTNTLVSFSPAVAFVLNEGSLVGLRTSFSNFNSSSDSFSIDGTFFEIGAVYRKYWTLKENIFFFAQSDAHYLGGSQESSNSSYSRSGFSLGVSPGVSARLTDWLLIDFTLGQIRYTNFTLTNEQDSGLPDNTNSSFGLNINSPSLGFVFSF